MKRSRTVISLILFFFAILLFCGSVIMLAWSFWPADRTSDNLPLPSLQPLEPTPVSLLVPSVALLFLSNLRFKRIFWIAAVLLLAIQLACSTSMSAAPQTTRLPVDGADSETQVPIQPTNPEQTTPPGEGGAEPEPGEEIPGEGNPEVDPPQLPPAAPQMDSRLLVIEWPETIKVGDSDILRLTLQVNESGQITPTAEIGGHEVTGEAIELPYIYDTHNVVAEARLSIAGLDIDPGQEISETVMPGRDVSFYWSIHAEDVGRYRGTLWLYLNLVPKSGGNIERQTLMARPMEIEAISFLGLGADTTRLAGAAGSLVSFVMGIPFLENVLSRLWRRLKKKV